MPRLGNIVGATLATLIFTASTAFAGIGGSITPTDATGPVNVGQVIAFTPPPSGSPALTLTNDSDLSNLGNYLVVSGIKFTPACGAGTGVCTAGQEDPNVFQLSNLGKGAPLSSCDGVVFNVSLVNATTGELQLLPTNTTAAAAIAAGDLSITVASNTGFPHTAINFIIQIDSELLLVTNGQNTTTWTVTRGFNGTAAAAHASGAPVVQQVTLGPNDGSGSPTLCEIDFTPVVLPAFPSSGLQVGGVLNKLTHPSGTDVNGPFTTLLARAGFSLGGAAQVFQNAGSATITVTGPTLAITKNPKGGTINAGSPAVFTIVITNTGSGAATNVLMTDTLPNSAGLNWTLNPPVAGCAITGSNPQVLSCTTLTVPAAGSVTLTVSSPTSAAACPATMTNTSTITGSNDVLTLSIADTGTIACNQVTADLSITKDDGKTVVTPGTSTTYTVTVTNGGPTTATGAILIDPAVAGLSKTAVACAPVPGQCSVAPSIASLEAGFALPALATGQTYSITITANITATTGLVTNAATVTPPAGTINPGTTCSIAVTPPNTRTFNPATGACTATDVDTVTPVANLFISKTNGTTTLPLGAVTTYTVTVTNQGPSEVTGATVTDPAPVGLTIGNWTCAVTTPGTPGTVTTACGAASGSGPLNTTANLQVNGVVTYTISATLTATSGSVTNTANVTPPGGTTNTGAGCVTGGGITRTFNPANGTCSSSDTDTVSLFTFSITKTPSAPTLATNAPLSFTITVTNNGPSAANGSILTDVLPASGFSATGVSCTTATGGAVCPAGVTLANLTGPGLILTTFPSGGAVTFVVTGTFTATTGSITNTSTISPPPGVAVPPQTAQASVSVFVLLVDVPTLNEYALFALMLMLAAAGGIYYRRSRF